MRVHLLDAFSLGFFWCKALLKSIGSYHSFHSRSTRLLLPAQSSTPDAPGTMVGSEAVKVDRMRSTPLPASMCRGACERWR